MRVFRALLSSAGPVSTKHRLRRAMPRERKTLGERAASSAQVVREETFGLEPRVVKVGGRFY